VLDWCQRFSSSTSMAVKTTTDAMRRLHGVLHGIAADGLVTAQEAIDLPDREALSLFDTGSLLGGSTLPTAPAAGDPSSSPPAADPTTGGTDPTAGGADPTAMPTGGVDDPTGLGSHFTSLQDKFVG